MRALYCFIIAALFIPFALCRANQSEQDNVVFLQEGQVAPGDFFACGSSVELSGVVQGDAYIAAGQAIVDGVIEGDLLLLCGGADISGHVKGSIRVLGGQVTLSGVVDKNVTAVSGNVILSPSSVVQGSAFITACNADLQGTLENNAKFLIFSLRNSAHIDGDVTAYVGQMRIMSKGFIGGSLSYRSAEAARIDERARILGAIDYHPSIFYHVVDHPWLTGLVIGSRFLTVVMNFLFTFVFGWILLRLFPTKISCAVDSLSRQTIKCLATGVSALVLLPVISLVLLITVLGAPFAVALIALNILGFYTAKLFVVMWLSQKALDKIGIKASRLMGLFLGLIAYYVIAEVPYLGQVAIVSAVVLGTGAIILAQGERRNLFSLFTR